MKKLLWIVFVTGSLSFQVRKPKTFIPPGTVQITETFYADETEIPNQAWLEYETWTRIKYGANSPEHLATLPDTTVWRGSSLNEAYIKFYYRHPAYKNFPVVGISYEQALAFCKWRTNRVKEFYAIVYKKEMELEYRLPTKEEWELLTNNGLNVFSNMGKTSKGYAKLNCLREPADSTNRSAEQKMMLADVTAPVYSFWKNDFGLYNTIGNVAEMTSEPGVCKGGSWFHKMEECRVGKDLTYLQPASWLGFRCICTTKKQS